MVRIKFLFLTFLAVASLHSQDSTITYKNYFGFAASRVSGVGLLFGTEATPDVNLQFTGGIFRTSSNSFSSFGLELQYNLQNSSGGRIYVGPAFGGFNETNDIGTSHEGNNSEFVVGLAMGVVVPIKGIFSDRLRASATLYYPTFYKDNSISVGFGATLHFLF